MSLRPGLRCVEQEHEDQERTCLVQRIDYELWSEVVEGTRTAETWLQLPPAGQIAEAPSQLCLAPPCGIPSGGLDLELHYALYHLLVLPKSPPLQCGGWGTVMGSPTSANCSPAQGKFSTDLLRLFKSPYVTFNINN